MKKRINKHSVILIIFFCMTVIINQVPIKRVEMNLIESDKSWYQLSNDWVNVTLTDGVTVVISLYDCHMYWYWNRTVAHDRRFNPYSAIRVETWGYNEGICFEKEAERSSEVFEFDDALVVNLQWKTSILKETLVTETLVFYEDLPYFYVSSKQKYNVDPNKTELTGGYANGLEPQICIFLDGGDEGGVISPDRSATIIPYSIDLNNSTPVTYQWMEYHRKFPWMYLHDSYDNATVGVIVLNVYPPVYDLMASGSDRPNEIQITFMDAEEGYASGVWYFPQGFEWFTQFIVYPTYDDDPPYYDKIDRLAKALYSDDWVFHEFTPYAFTSGAVVSYPPGFERMTILNRIGMLYMFGDHGVVFWNGTIPRHSFKKADGSSCHLLAFSRDWYYISNDLITITGNENWSKIKTFESSRYGHHVEVGEKYDFIIPKDSLNVSLTHTWEAWNDSDMFKWTIDLNTQSPSNITRAYFKLRAFGQVMQLNKTTYEIWTNTVWGREPAVTLIFKNDTVNYDPLTGFFYINLINNFEPVEYPTGNKVSIEFYIWPHYGHILNSSHIPLIHNISTSVIAPFHTHYYHDPSFQTLVPYYTNTTLIDAKFLPDNKELYVTVLGDPNRVGMIKINASGYGPLASVLNAKEFNLQGNLITIYTNPSSDPEIIRLTFEYEDAPILKMSMKNLIESKNIYWDPLNKDMKIQVSTHKETILQIYCGDYGRPESIYKEKSLFEMWLYNAENGILTLIPPIGDVTFDIHFVDRGIGNGMPLDTKRIYEVGENYIETNSLIVHGESLLFSIAELPATGSGLTGKIDLNYYNRTIIEQTNGARTTHWTVVFFNDTIAWFGQWYNSSNGAQPADYTFYFPSNRTLHHGMLPYTNDCNEFISSTLWNNEIYIGERIEGGHTFGSLWPNGGGLWKYNGSFTRIWENPNHLEVFSLIPFNSKLYMFLSDPSYYIPHYKTEIWTYDGSHFTLVANLSSSSLSLEGGAEVFKNMLVVGGRSKNGEGILVFSSDGIKFDLVNLNSSISESPIYCVADLCPLNDYGELILSVITGEGFEGTINSGWNYALYTTPDLKNFNRLTHERDGALYGTHGSNIVYSNNTLFIGVLTTNIGAAIDAVTLPINQIGIHTLTIKGDPLPFVSFNDVETDSTGYRQVSYLDTGKFFIQMEVPNLYLPLGVMNANNFTIDGKSIIIHPGISEKGKKIDILFYNTSVPQPYIVEATSRLNDVSWNPDSRCFKLLIDGKSGSNVTVNLDLAGQYPQGYVIRCDGKIWSQSYDQYTSLLTVWIVLDSKSVVSIEPLISPERGESQTIQLIIVTLATLIIIYTIYYNVPNHLKKIMNESTTLKSVYS